MFQWLKSKFGPRDPHNEEIEAAVMPLSGRVVVMSASVNEVVMPSKARAITDAVLVHRSMVTSGLARPAPVVADPVAETGVAGVADGGEHF